MAVSPLPLSVRHINEVLSAHPVMIDRDLLDTCVFAIDDIHLEELSKKQEEKSKDNTN